MTLPLQTLVSMPEGSRLFSMGEYVTYTHRAGVARFKKLNKELPDIGWKITQGATSGEGGVDPYDAPFIEGLYWNHRRYMFAKFIQRKLGYNGFINKTVMVWPEDGNGWVIGTIRKSIGVSVGSSRSTYHNEYDQGYHVVEMYVDLYVVKKQFYGTDYILCPIWSVVA